MSRDGGEAAAGVTPGAVRSELDRFTSSRCPDCGTPGQQRHLSAVGGCRTCREGDPRPVYRPARGASSTGDRAPAASASMQRRLSGLRNVFALRHSGKVCYRLPSGNMVHVKPGCRC